MLIKRITELLEARGFHRDGSYFRRTVGAAQQALYLEPVRYGGAYHLEMLVTFSEINPSRRNIHSDAHLRFRLSGYYHPLGAPSSQQPWTCTYRDLQPGDALLVTELPDALNAFLQWLDEFPSVSETSRKFRDASYDKRLGIVMRYEFFCDLGEPVPTPT